MHTTTTIDDAFEVSNPRFSQTGPEYPPLVKLKIGVGNTGDPTAQFNDQNRELTSMEHVAKGVRVKVIADLGNIWFMNGETWCHLVRPPSPKRPRHETFCGLVWRVHTRLLPVNGDISPQSVDLEPVG